MGTYSFKDVQAALSGPWGTINLGDGSQAAEEGVTIAMVEDKNQMTVGADGAVMHSLRATKAAKLTVRLLKTSPTNAALSLAYNLSTSSSLLHGQGVFTLSNPVTGDNVDAAQVAFLKQPDLTFATVGGMNEWTFDAGQCVELLGTGSPSV